MCLPVCARLVTYRAIPIANDPQLGCGASHKPAPFFVCAHRRCRNPKPSALRGSCYVSSNSHRRQRPRQPAAAQAAAAQHGAGRAGVGVRHGPGAAGTPPTPPPG